MPTICSVLWVTWMLWKWLIIVKFLPFFLRGLIELYMSILCLPPLCISACSVLELTRADDAYVNSYMYVCVWMYMFIPLCLNIFCTVYRKCVVYVYMYRYGAIIHLLCAKICYSFANPELPNLVNPHQISELCTFFLNQFEFTICCSELTNIFH